MRCNLFCLSLGYANVNAVVRSGFLLLLYSVAGTDAESSGECVIAVRGNP